LKRHAAGQPRFDDRGVKLAAINEDRGHEVQKHQRDDHRCQAGIHRDVAIGEAGEILAEHDARNQRRYHGEDDAGQDLQKSSTSRRKPGVKHEQRHDQRNDGNAETGEIDEMLVGFHDQRQMSPRRLDDQGTEYDQERHGERGDCRDQRVADRFQPKPVPAPLFDHGVSAVERYS